MDEHKKQIERRAYELWEEEGRPSGREQAHWDQAAREFDVAKPDESARADPSREAFAETPNSPVRKRRASAKPRTKKA